MTMMKAKTMNTQKLLSVSFLFLLAIMLTACQTANNPGDSAVVNDQSSPHHSACDGSSGTLDAAHGKREEKCSLGLPSTSDETPLHSTPKTGSTTIGIPLSDNGFPPTEWRRPI